MIKFRPLIKPLLKMLILMAVFVVAICLARKYNLHVYLTDTEKGAQFIKSFQPYSQLIFIFFQIMQVVIAPFPGEATGFIGGYVFGIVMGTVFSTIGLSLGSWAAFIIARRFGMPLIERVFKPETIRKFDHFIELRGTYISFILFVFPGFPKDTLCYFLGLSHMKLTTFMIISSIGRLFGTAFLSASGASLRNEQIALFLALAILGGLFFLWGIFHSRSIMNRLRHHKKIDKPSP